MKQTPHWCTLILLVFMSLPSASARAQGMAAGVSYLHEPNPLFTESNASPTTRLRFVSLEEMETVLERVEQGENNFPLDADIFLRSYESRLKFRTENDLLDSCHATAIRERSHPDRPIQAPVRAHPDLLARIIVESELGVVGKIKDIVPGWDVLYSRPTSLVILEVTEVLHKLGGSDLTVGDRLHYLDQRVEFRLRGLRHCFDRVYEGLFPKQHEVGQNLIVAAAEASRASNTLATPNAIAVMPAERTGPSDSEIRYTAESLGASTDLPALREGIKNLIQKRGARNVQD